MVALSAEAGLFVYLVMPNEFTPSYNGELRDQNTRCTSLHPRAECTRGGLADRPFSALDTGVRRDTKPRRQSLISREGRGGERSEKELAAQQRTRRSATTTLPDRSTHSLTHIHIHTQTHTTSTERTTFYYYFFKPVSDYTPK